MVTRRVRSLSLSFYPLGQGWDTQLGLIWFECSCPASSLTRRVTNNLLRFAVKRADFPMKLYVLFTRVMFESKPNVEPKRFVFKIVAAYQECSSSFVRFAPATFTTISKVFILSDLTESSLTGA